MAKKDYYLILGVARGENVRGIREAFHDLAKRYHPDRAGPGHTDRFQDIQEAYEVLSQPEKRNQYDHELEQSQPAASKAEPIHFRSPSRPEPLIPEPMSVLRGFETIRPSREPLYERFLRNFTGEGIPKGERLEGLNVEVMLSSEDALTGGTVPMGVPVFFICPYCDGSGRNWLFPCMNCNAQGVIEEEKPVTIYVPPGVRDGSIVEVPVHRLGIENFYLRLHMRISH